MASKLTVSSINKLGYREFIVRFGNVVEGNSLCAAAVWSRRSFSSFENFVGAMCQFIDDLPRDGKAGIFEAFLTLQLAGSLCHATRKGNKQKQAYEIG